MTAFNQDFSLIASAILPTGTTTRAGVRNFFTNPGGNTAVAIQWDVPTDVTPGNNVIYNIQYKRFIDYVWIDTPEFQSTAAQPVVFILGLTVNTAYMFRVRANRGRYTRAFSGFSSKGVATEAYDGQAVTGIGVAITASDGTTYALTEVANLPYHILQNSSEDGVSSEVIQLLYHDHRIFQENKDHNWFSKALAGDSWLQTTDPRRGAPPVGNLPPTFSIRDQPVVAGAVMAPRGGHVSSGTQITFIYWGDYWNTAPFPAPNDISSAMTASLGGAYFGGLQEYEIFAKPSLIKSVTVPGTPPDFSASGAGGPDGVGLTQLQSFLGSLFDNNTLPIPIIDNVLYMVMLPPLSHAISGIGAYHSHVLYRDLEVCAGFCFFPGAGGSGNASQGQATLDQFTIGLTHEIAENCTDPLDNLYGAFFGYQSTTNPGQEINDFNNQVQLVTNGIAQMGFYSNRARAIIIPTAETPVPTLPTGPFSNNVATAGSTGLFTFGTTATSMSFQFATPSDGQAQQPYAISLQYARSCDFIPTTTAFGTFNIDPGTQTAFTLSGLTANTAYKLRVSLNGGRYSPYILANTLANGAGDSPDGTLVYLPGQIITGAGNHTYELLETATPYMIKVDSTADGVGSEIINMVYSGGKVFFCNKDYHWFVKTVPTDAYTATNDPRIGAPVNAALPATFTVTQTSAQTQNTCMSYTGGITLNAPTIDYVFWGSDWNTQTVHPPQVWSQMSNLCAGPYFSGLGEFGFTGKPTLGRYIVYTGTTPPNFATATNPTAALSGLLTSLWDGGLLTVPMVDNNLTMIVLPASAGNIPGQGGAHGCFYYRGNMMQFGYSFGFTGSSLIDSYTVTLAHETVEAMTDAGNGFQTASGAPAPLLGWFGPGPTSAPGALVLEEDEDFAGSTAAVSGTVVAGRYSNRARAVIIPTS